MATKSKDSKSIVNETWKNVKPYKDIFDTIDDMNDGVQYTTDELNRYFQSGHLKSTINEEEIIEDDILNDSDHIEIIQEEEEEQQDEETILSQKLSQLSTKNENETNSSSTVDRKRPLSTIASSNASFKKMKMTDADDIDNNDTKQDQIPTYLLMNNKSFVHMAQNTIKTIHSISTNDIQQLAVSIHHIAAFHIQKQITEIYLKSVTGTLQESENDLIEVDRRVWPMQVKSFLLTHRKLTMTPSPIVTTIMETHTEDEQLICEQILHQRLQDMNQNIEHYQRQLNEKKNSLIGFTSTMEESIQTYVQEYGVKPLEMKRDLKIAIVTYNYESQILERKYLQETPNQYQIEVAKRLIDTRREVEKSKRALLELKQGIFYNKSSISFDSVQVSMPIWNNNTTMKEKVPGQLLHKHKKLIQYKKLDLLAIHILQAETTYYQFQNIFDYELSKMWKNHRNLVKDHGMTTSLINLIEQHLNNITNRWRDVFNYRIDYFLRNSYDELQHKNTNEKEQTMKIVEFSSSLIIDTTCRFTNEQLQLLSHGPAYVPPCQMYISSSNESIDDIVKKQYAPLKHQLMNLFSKYKIHLPLKIEIEEKTYNRFKDLFLKSIPSNLYQRALYEKKLIQSIRYSLNKNNLILRRTVDNMNTFYVGNIQDFEAKADKYLTKSEEYKVLINMDEEINEQPLHTALKNMMESMNSLLEQLKTHKAIKEDLYKRLVVDPTKVKLPNLYFLPNVSKENDITLVPIITSKLSATWKIGKYLNQLLRSFADEKLHSTTFYDEADFIR
ncbi:unnamed protein product, partial [Rotaria sp. Silwood2]